MSRSYRLLRRIGVGLLCVLVGLLILAEDLLRFAGFLLHKILPADFERFLKERSNAVAFGVFGVALAIYLVAHAAEYAAFWWFNYYWTGMSLLIFSKFYGVAVLGYLGRVYSDRLLAVGWINWIWEKYLASKKWLESFEWYQFAHTFVHDLYGRVKGAIKTFRQRFKGESRLGSLLQAIRRRWRS